MARPRKTDQQLQAEGKYRGENGRIYKMRQNQIRRIRGDVPEGYMRSPKTGRLLKIGSYTYKKTWREVADYYRNISKNKRKEMKRRQRQNKKLFDEVDKLLGDEDIQMTILIYEEFEVYLNKLYNDHKKECVAKDIECENIEAYEIYIRSIKKIVKYKQIEYAQINSDMYDVSRKLQQYNEEYLSRLESKEEERTFKIVKEELEKQHIEDPDSIASVINKLETSEFTIDMIYMMKPRPKKGYDKRLFQTTKDKKVNEDDIDDIFEEHENKMLDSIRHNSVNNQVVMSKFIEYTKNPNARNFGELFDQETCKYVETNARANSCFVNVIVNTYYEPFQKKKKDGKQYYADLTYEKLIRILDIEDKEQNIGLSIKHAIKYFFKVYSLGLDIINSMDQLIYRYRPNEGLNTHIRPQVLCLYVINNHVFKCNKNMEAVKQYVVGHSIENMKKTLRITDRFNFYETYDVEDEEEEEKKPMMKFIDNIDEIYQCINDNPDVKVSFYLKSDNMKEILYDMITKYKVIPIVKSSKNGYRILSIKFRLDKINYEITRPTTKGEGEIEKTISEDQINDYFKIEKDFRNNTLKKEYLSEYPEDVRRIENEYKMNACGGYFKSPTDVEQDMNGDYWISDNQKISNDSMETGLYNTIDFNKCYPSAWMKINKVPIFTYFDKYTAYDGSDVDDYCMYIIQTHNTEQNHAIIFDSVYARVYGFVLMYADEIGIKYTIIYMRKYSKLEDANFEDTIKQLFENDKIDMSLRKKIANATTGLLEKKRNRKNVTKVYDTYEEAQDMQLLFMKNGIQSNIMTIDNIVEEVDDYTENTKSRLYANHRKEIKNVTKYLFLLSVYREEELCDGFRQIKEMIYCMTRIKLHKLYVECKEHGLYPIGTHTDCVLVTNDRDEILNSGMKFSDKIGEVKLEASKKRLLSKKIERKINKLNVPEMKTAEQIIIKDEWNTEEINKTIQDKNVLILADIPGAGKSTIVKNYTKNKNILFVVPTNRLGLRNFKVNGFDSVTVHKLLQLGVNRNCKMKEVDISDYDVICFDEIFLNNSYILSKIHAFMKKYRSKQYMATGDDRQLQPIEDVYDQINEIKRNYMDMIKSMFDKFIVLHIDKRRNNEKEKEEVIKLMIELFKPENKPMDVLEKYFKIIDKKSDIKTKFNISYGNYKADEINKYIHQKESKHVTKKKVIVNNCPLYEGLTMICKRTDHKIGIICNNMYIIKKINIKTAVISDLLTDEEYTIHTKILLSFKLPYVATGFACQGETIDENITLFECDSPYVSKQWIWTCITRVRNLNQITIFKSSEHELDILKKTKRNQYFELKIKSYKNCDMKCKREYNENEYIDKQWFASQLKEHEWKCHWNRCKLEGICGDGNFKSNITADRINNKVAHIKSNCVISCTSCNISRANKPDKFY